MFKRIVTTALIFGMAAIAPPARAQSGCADRARIVRLLADDFRETPRGIGLKSYTEVIEVWASAKTGTWTLLLSNADGLSCVIASGTAWADAPRRRADTPASNPVTSYIVTE